jgi:hypothetical protein
MLLSFGAEKRKKKKMSYRKRERYDNMAAKAIFVRFIAATLQPELFSSDSLRLHCSRSYFRSIHRGYIAAEAIFARFIAATLQPRLFSPDSLRSHCSRGYFRSIHRGYIAANLNK